MFKKLFGDRETANATPADTLFNVIGLTVIGLLIIFGVGNIGRELSTYHGYLFAGVIIAILWLVILIGITKASISLAESIKQIKKQQDK